MPALKKEDIEYLSGLARIAVSEEEKDELAQKLGSVLSYISEISNIVTEAESAPRAGDLRNIMREDGAQTPGGTYTDAIIANAPQSEDGYFKVKRIM